MNELLYQELDSATAKRLSVADNEQARMFAMIAATALALFVTFCPGTAYAFDFDLDVVSKVTTSLIAPLIAALTTFVQAVMTAIADIGLMGKLTGSTEWQDLLSGVYGFVNRTQTTIVIPVAMQILTLAMMFKLLGATKVAESQDMQPLIPKIAVTLVGYFLAAFLIQNSMAIITVGYELMQDILNGLEGDSFSTRFIENWAITEEALEGKLPTLNTALIYLLCFIIMALFSGICYLVAVFCFYSKVLKIYIYAFFSPIPLALVGMDSTRSWAIGFIKGLASTFLSIVIMYFILRVFPYLIITVLANSYPDISTTTSIGELIFANIPAGVIAPCLEIAACCLLLMFFMVKSSSLAREVLGG